MSVKTEQQVYSEVSSLVSQFLTSQGWNEWATNILQWGQPSLQEVPSPAILMNYEQGEKYGWVSTKYPYSKETKQGYTEITYYQRRNITFTFFKDPKSLLDDSFSVTTYISPIDVAERLRTWFLSDLGVSALRGLGYGSFNTSIIRNPPMAMDDEIYARTPNFTITLVSKEKILDNNNNFTNKFNLRSIALTTTNEEIRNGNSNK